MNKHSGSNVIRALDLAVAFATLETYGVVDSREQATERVAEAGLRLEGHRPAKRRLRHPSRIGESCTPGRRPLPVGRPSAATPAGRRRHRSAVRRIDRLGRAGGKAPSHPGR